MSLLHTSVHEHCFRWSSNIWEDHRPRAFPAFRAILSTKAVLFHRNKKEKKRKMKKFTVALVRFTIGYVFCFLFEFNLYTVHKKKKGSTGKIYKLWVYASESYFLPIFENNATEEGIAFLNKNVYFMLILRSSS